jgi:hypothetical protein
MGLGSSFALALVGLTRLDLSWPELLIAHWEILIPAVLVGPLLLWIESRRHPDQWREWRRHMDSCSARDVLVLRHIPDWRAR